MSETTRLWIWIGFIVWDLWIILDHEMKRKEIKHDRSRRNERNHRRQGFR